MYKELTQAQDGRRKESRRQEILTETLAKNQQVEGVDNEVLRMRKLELADQDGGG